MLICSKCLSFRLVEKWRGRLNNTFKVGAVSMGLSKAFSCIPHDIIIAKLAAYGMNSSALKLM